MPTYEKDNMLEITIHDNSLVDETVCRFFYLYTVFTDIVTKKYCFAEGFSSMFLNFCNYRKHSYEKMRTSVVSIKEY